jgi:RIO kinase 1
MATRLEDAAVDVSEPALGEDYEDEEEEEDDSIWEEEACALASKYESLVSLQPLQAAGGGGGGGGGGGAPSLSQSAGSALSKLERKGAQAKHTGLTRDERATVEQVLDPRTRLILFKLINTGTVESINGCVSTGKEANVYHAFGAGGAEYAIKVYKTSILVFKDRDRYVSGEFRFRHGYCKANPRKMVKMWAEKEMRNYRRLLLAEVPCPDVHLLRDHVLLMGFIGRDGHAAPRLKDARLSDRQYVDACRQVMLLLRTIFHKCRLVHGDFSEYNLLWYKNTVYCIDVSQAVEHDHPNALAFLRKDCENAIHFFRKYGVARVPSLQRLFEFVTSPLIKGDDAAAAAYDRMLDEQEAAEQADEERTERLANLPYEEGGDADAAGDAAAEAAVSEEVFKQIHIPRTMEELGIRQAEVDIEAAKRGKGALPADTAAYMKLMGINQDLTVGVAEEGGGGGGGSSGGGGGRGVQPGSSPVGAGKEGEGEEGEEGESDDEGSEEDSDEGEEGEEGDRFAGRIRRHRMLHKEEDKDEKRERKAAVKAAQREARTHKTVILAARAPAMRAPWSRVARPAPCPRALAARACPDRAPCCCCCCSAPLVLASCSSRSQSMSRRLLERGARRNRGWHAHELDCTADGRIAESQ